MTKWFQERYIPRDEHHRIVDYYKGLVVQLHRRLREARALHEALAAAGAGAVAGVAGETHLTESLAGRRRPDEPLENRSEEAPVPGPSTAVSNVIRINFRPRL